MVIFLLNALAVALEEAGFTVVSFDVAGQACEVGLPADADFLGTLRVTLDFDHEGQDVVWQIGGLGRVPHAAYNVPGVVRAAAARVDQAMAEWQ